MSFFFLIFRPKEIAAFLSTQSNKKSSPIHSSNNIFSAKSGINSSGVVSYARPSRSNISSNNVNIGEETLHIDSSPGESKYSSENTSSKSSSSQKSHCNMAFSGDQECVSLLDTPVNSAVPTLFPTHSFSIPSPLSPIPQGECIDY